MNMLFTTPMVEHLALMRAVYHPAMVRLATLFQQSSDGSEAGAAILVGGFSLVTLFLIVGPVILWIWMLVWVNKDATKNGQSGCMPMMMVFFLGPIGLIIYLMMRPKN